MNLEKYAQIDLNNALKIEELFWLEKSRIKWHINGDRNTRYFHRLTRIKKFTKMINVLRVGDDVLTEPTEIASHIVNHFQQFFLLITLFKATI